MKRNRWVRRVKVSADGKGVVSHAGVGLLREMAEATGLVDGVTAALIDTYRGGPVHAPGRVFTDMAVAIADGADAVSGIAVLGDREDLFGPVASMPTAWRVLDRVDAAHLDRVRAANAAARAGAWAAGAGPDLTGELRLDFDATITVAHSEKETRPRPGSTPMGSTRCCVSWTARRSPPVRRSPACCAPVTPGRTPPPITSLCWTWPWPVSRRPRGRDLLTRPRGGCSRAATRLVRGWPTSRPPIRGCPLWTCPLWIVEAFRLRSEPFDLRSVHNGRGPRRPFKRGVNSASRSRIRSATHPPAWRSAIREPAVPGNATAFSANSGRAAYRHRLSQAEVNRICDYCRCLT